MSSEECNFYSDKKCIATDLELCDFTGDNFKECLRYRVYYLKPKLVQLR